jgi:RNA polymerase primary sigma factor
MKDLDVINLHLKDINKISLLTPEEEVELAKKVAQGDKKAREKLLVSNMRFVVNVAKKYQNRGLELEDLISEGYIGLIEAVEKFDVTRGYHFISYAVWWIRQSILKAISEKSRAIRLPMNKTNELLQIEKAKNQLANRKKTTEEEELDAIASMLGMTKYHVREMMNISKEVISLDSPFDCDEENKSSLGDIIPSELYSDPQEEILSSSLKDTIQLVLKTLDPKSAEILKMRYGLNGEEGMSLAQIGARFNLTKERIRQIEKKALLKINTTSRKDKLIDYVA